LHIRYKTATVHELVGGSGRKASRQVDGVTPSPSSCPPLWQMEDFAITKG